MEVNLSWDLFVIVFFTVIIAYSFIIGRNQTLKIIISSYIAILASDGLGNILERYFISEDPLINVFQFANQETSLVLLKIFVFIFTIVIIATRGRFTINTGSTGSHIMNGILSLVYGILSAGLITSTILLYTSGASLVQESVNIMNEAVKIMYRESFMVQAMVNNYNIWFSLPAVTFVLSSLITEETA